MIQLFDYEGSPIQFDTINGQIMANATLMAKAHNKDMSSIFKSKSWVEFENIVSQDIKVNSVDLRRSKSGSIENGGGTWIHEELVIEMARRLNPKFALWCNRKIAQLHKEALESSTQSANPKSPEILLLEQHTKREVQISNSKEINTFNFNKAGVQATIDYNRMNCILHTGKKPNELIQIAKDKKIPSKHRASGKEVIRYYKPEVAASMSITDELCKSGIDTHEAAGLSMPAIPLLKVLIKNLISQ